MHTAGAGGAGADLDTEITGEPASISSAALWLSATAAVGVEDGAQALRRARQEADADWAGDAGPAFGAKMTGAHDKVSGLHRRVTALADSLESFAGSMRACQNRMADIRGSAAGAGLGVRGHVIEHPGPGAARPPDLSGVPMTAEQVQAYEADVLAYNRHQQLLTAFYDAAGQAAEVRATFAQAQQTLADDYEGMSGGDAVLTGTDFVAAAALARMSSYHAKLLRADARHWASEAAWWTERMRTTDYRAYQRMPDLLGPDAPRRMFDSDAAHERYLQNRANASSTAATEAENRFAGAAKNVSRGLVGVGIGVDLLQGESVPQAVASNVGGYAAGAAVTAGGSAGTSMLAATAAGAAMGSAVPVVGTVVGAGVGLAVGLFASGAIDSLFENGPDVERALDEGAEAVTDTVGAVG